VAVVTGGATPGRAGARGGWAARGGRGGGRRPDAPLLRAPADQLGFRSVFSDEVQLGGTIAAAVQGERLEPWQGAVSEKWPRPSWRTTLMPYASRPSSTRRLVATGMGFSLHAGTAVHGNDRQGLERLRRYGALGPVADCAQRQAAASRHPPARGPSACAVPAPRLTTSEEEEAPARPGDAASAHLRH
jgi:hypothetical protein